MSNTQHKSHNNCRKYQNIGHKQSESKIILPNMSLTESLMLTPEPFHPIIGIEHVASEGSDSTENILIILFYTWVHFFKDYEANEVCYTILKAIEDYQWVNYLNFSPGVI